MVFLTHFQLLVHYETSTHLLMSLKKDTVTHISDLIHEWRRRCGLVRFDIIDHLLTESFTKYFINKIAEEIAMGGCVTKH